MFKTLDAVGWVLQIIGAASPVISAVAAILASAGGYSSLAPVLLYTGGGLMFGAIVYAFGGLVRAVVVISRNSQRSAHALNRIAQAQTGVAEFLAEDGRKSHSIKSLK